MSRLKVVLRGAQISEIGLNSEREYIAGRKESCDIRLQPEKGISREHFSLKFEDGKWKVRSLSRFGEIFTLGQRVEALDLEHGQSFQVPPYEFTYYEVNEAVDSSSEKNQQSVSEDEKTVIGVVQQIPYIKMLSAQGEVREMLRLEFGDLWVAGRDSSCQIIIPDQRVSRRQFEIRKINGIYTLIDLDSVNGTFLNGSNVSSTDPHPLKSGDAITVLDNTMYFELHDPNFQYRMERIDVPPLQLVPDVEEVDLESIENGNIEDQPLQDFSEQMLEASPEADQLYIPEGGPFTGIPPAGDTENQYYSFQPAQSHSNQGKFSEIWSKIKSRPLVLISLVLLFLGVMYYISEQMNSPDSSAQNQVAKSGDPFMNLTPEQQNNVSSLYDSAKAAMIQDKYGLVKENLDKLHIILPGGYKDSKMMLDEAVAKEQAFLNQQEYEKSQAERLQQEETIKNTIAQCEKLLGPEITTERMDNCLVPAVEIYATHPDVIRLKEATNTIVQARMAKEESQKSYEEQVKQLADLFKRAEDIRIQGFPYKAIKAYQLVLESKLPDPKKLKAKATARIKYIEDTIKERTSKNIKNAEDFIKEGKLKLAIKALDDALIYDPENKELKEKSEKYSQELRMQAMVLYQESIIDESFGYVDGSETRPGAKDKWKKIIDIDLEDGEYYRKAFIKLKKYGVY